MTLLHYKFNTKGFLKLLMLTSLVFALFSFLVEEVYADVPTVLQIENLTEGSLGKIRIHVRHANPSSSHYVDQLEIFGRSGSQSLTKILTLQPQSSNPFTVEASEEVPGSYLINAYVKVRAHCNLHGWSNWSDEVQVPEFHELASIVLMAMTVSILLLRKRS
jgi:desulfoferrodoxin (superoxide reductase-like protein)